jgi:hypothetical protein
MQLRHVGVVCIAILLAVGLSGASSLKAAPKTLKPKFTESIASDTSPALRDLARRGHGGPDTDLQFEDLRRDRGRAGQDSGFSGDPRVDRGVGATALTIGAPLANFEGLSNQDNFNIFGFRVNPPDPVGDVGPNHYVEMINLAYAVYDKSGNLLLGPLDIGSLWTGFAVDDCTDPAGDPIVLYDQFADRWLLTQFTSAGPIYYNCVAISQTPDPTGPYYRYAFTAGVFFPDYPKYGVWKDSYILTSRDFGPTTEYGISVYALEKNKMVDGLEKARAVQFFLDSEEVPLHLIGDGLLPPDVDGKTKPRNDAPAPIVGTMDSGAPYGAPFDGLNIFELDVQWNARPDASFRLAAQPPVAAFDSIFPCAPTSRDCLPQPGITNPAQYLDILSYRQRPTHRLAYRNFGTYETFVTSQSVEALPGVAGMRWYEIRRINGAYSVHQQGTYSPADGVHRWMGSAAMDRNGGIALAYSVVNGTTVFPGIRYTGRVAGDAPGTLPLGESVIVNGTGVQLTTNSRWGDYTSLNLDPVDDCTFWYVNEYYTAAGQASSVAGWHTRIASFKLPGCVAP